MLLALFTIGSLTFWLVTIGFCAAIVAAVENEKGALATVSFIAYVIGLHLLTNFNVIHWFMDNLNWILLSALCYFIVGAVWGVLKWSLFVSKIGFETEEHYRRHRARFLRDNKVDNSDLDSSVPEALKETWQEYLKESLYHINFKPLRPGEYRSTILTWMSFWPASLLWTLVNDPVRAIFRHIYAYLSITLENISKRAFSSVTKLQNQDLPTNTNSQ